MFLADIFVEDGKVENKEELFTSHDSGCVERKKERKKEKGKQAFYECSSEVQGFGWGETGNKIERRLGVL